MKNVSLTGRGGAFGSIAKRAGLAGLAILTLAVASTANATTTTTEARPSTLRMRMVADNVVVSPGGSAPAAAPAQPASQTVVVPQGGSAPAAQNAEPTKRTNVNADVQGPKNYMSTIAISALMGGLAGGLIGGAIYFLGDRNDEINIAYWAAGGVLVGTGVGLTQVLVQESRVSNAAASRFPSDPAPTVRLALVNVKF